jgi:Xaa-Pro aminopeptidase
VTPATVRLIDAAGPSRAFGAPVPLRVSNTRTGVTAVYEEGDETACVRCTFAATGAAGTRATASRAAIPDQKRRSASRCLAPARIDGHHTPLLWRSTRVLGDNPPGLGETAEYPRFSDAEFARRHATVRKIMESRSLQVVLAYGNRASHNEIQYLTNYAVALEGLLLFSEQSEMVLWVRYANHRATARAVSIVEDVRWGGDDVAVAAAAELHSRGLAGARIAICGQWPHAGFVTLQRSCPAAELVDIQPLMAAERLIKSAEEVEWARRGAELSDLAIEALARDARPGMSEHTLAAIVQSAYYGLGGRTHIHYIGSTPMNAPTLCAPAQIQSSRRLAAGDVILTELSAMHHGYWGQVLRTFVVSAEPTAEYQRMHDVALTTFEQIVGALRDGVTSDDLLEIGEGIHRAGYTICDDLVHMAIGGAYAPYLRTRRSTQGTPPAITYRQDMLVVVQPNVVTEDQRMGVQVGEMVRITKDGVERLHRVPLELIRCG